MYTPQTDIRLHIVPFDPSGAHVCKFPNLSTQQAYFDGNIQFAFSSCSYVRGSESTQPYVKLAGHVDNYRNINYMSYRNSTFTSKWFYAFVTGVEYLTENTTKAYLMEDTYQTWLFEHILQPCFVRKEIVENDIAGLHTQPEDYEIGDYVFRGATDTWDSGINNPPSDNLAVVVASAVNLDDVNYEPNGGGIYGMISGVRYYAYDSYDGEVFNVLAELDKKNKADAVQHIFMCPTAVLPSGRTGHQINWTTGTMPRITTTPFLVGNYGTHGNATYGLYTPTNKKLSTYPYVKYVITNNTGVSADFKYEDSAITNTAINLETRFMLSPAMPMLCYPTNYRTGTALENSVASAPLPTCTWNSDTYSNWYAANAATLQAQAGNIERTHLRGLYNSLYDVGSNALTGLVNPFKSIQGSLNTIQNVQTMKVDYTNKIATYLAQITDAQTMPPQSKGHASGDISYLKGKMCFTAYMASLKPEYAAIIDAEMSMHGYVVNKVKIPNTSSRPNWNYTQTVGCNITGSLPANAITALQNMYDTGITFWKTPQNMYNYSLPNGA